LRWQCFSYPLVLGAFPFFLLPLSFASPQAALSPPFFTFFLTATG
jgi:hypothetical protein